MKRLSAKMAAWAVWVAMAAVVVPGAVGAMIGIGREGDYAIEIFAERSEVVRIAGGAKVTLPSEAEGLFRAADVRTGDGVWSGTGGGAAKADASVVRLVPGWWSCELELKEAERPSPVPVERFHLLRWGDLGGRFTARLDGLAQTNEAAWRDGLEAILGQMRTVFGGQSMVVGFMLFFAISASCHLFLSFSSEAMCSSSSDISCSATSSDFAFMYSRCEAIETNSLAISRSIRSISSR